jgi:hypothetical protein
MHGCSQGVDKQIVSGRQRSERLQYGAVIPNIVLELHVGS